MTDYLNFNIVLTVVQHDLYPREICLMGSWPNPEWFRGAVRDPLYFHTIIFTTEAFSDLQIGKDRSLATQRHLVKTLRLLQERITTPEISLATSDETILTVVILALIAEYLDDELSMANHVGGLQRMVRLRGGFAALRKFKYDLPGKSCRFVTKSSHRLAWRSNNLPEPTLG